MVLASDEVLLSYYHGYLPLNTTLPFISGFAPRTGPEGTEVTLTGINFTGTSVAFNGTSVGAGNFTVDSDTQIRVTVPVGATSGLLGVMNSAGTGTSSTAFTTPPVITSFSPGTGPVGMEVTLTGINFTGTSVAFNGTSATFILDSDTQIRATVPESGPEGTELTGRRHHRADHGHDGGGHGHERDCITSFSPESGPEAE